MQVAGVSSRSSRVVCHKNSINQTDRVLPICCCCRDLATELLEELNSETTTAVESLVAMELSGTLFAVSRREFSRASNQHLEGLRMLLATSFTAGSTATSPQGSPVTEAGGIPAPAHGSSDGSNGPAASTRMLPAVAMSGQMHAGLYDTALASQGIVLPPIPATATGTPELLSMMAAALTYYSLACRRLSDTVSMSIMHHLVTAFTTRFRWALAPHSHGSACLLFFATASGGAGAASQLASSAVPSHNPL